MHLCPFGSVCPCLMDFRLDLYSQVCPFKGHAMCQILFDSLLRPDLLPRPEMARPDRSVVPSASTGERAREAKHNPERRKLTAIHTITITNENLDILFRFCFRNGKANEFPQIFCCVCFHNDHVGHTQATSAGHTYKTTSSPEIFFRFCIWEKLNRGGSKPGGFPLFRERSRLCRGPFRDCSS